MTFTTEFLLRDKLLQELLSVGRFSYRLFSWLGFLIAGPILILSVIPLIVWKYLLGLVVRLKPGEKLGEELSFFDTVFAVDNFYTDPYASTAKFFILDGRLSLAKLKAHFCEKILYNRQECAPLPTAPSSSNSSNGILLQHEGGEGKGRWRFQRLHQIPRRFCWFYFWKKVPIHVDSHIREVNLKTNSSCDSSSGLESNNSKDVILGEDELVKFLGELMTNPFPLNSGLWEVILINNFQQDQSVVFLRVHHVIADGYTFNSMVDELICQRSQYIVKDREFSFIQKLNFLWTAPAWTINFFMEEMLKTNWMNREKKSTTGVLAITSIPLHVIKAVRRGSNCHFATIGLSLLAGALRRLFLELHHNDTSQLPDIIKIMHLLPKPNHPFDRMCNHWSAGSFKISMNTDNALQRLRMAERYFRDFTENNYSQLLETQSYVAGLMPAPLYSFVLARNYLTNMAFTSLPGYDGPAKICDRDIVDMYKICGLQYKQTAVGAAAYSHNGQLAFTIFANRDIVPTEEHARRLAKVYLHAELQELVEQLELDIDITL